MNCGKNVRLKPMKTISAASRAQPSGYRRPEISATKNADLPDIHERAANHDVVEMRDDEVGVGDVDVDAQCRKEQAGEVSDGEQAEKTEGVEHGGVVADGTFIKSGRPVEHFDGGRHRDRIAQQREHECGIDGNPATNM